MIIFPSTHPILEGGGGGTFSPIYGISCWIHYMLVYRWLYDSDSLSAQDF